MLLYCRFSLFLSTQGRVKIHFHALRPCSSLTLCAESGLWLRNALNVSSVIISLLFYIMAADSLTDALMLYLLLASQNGFVAENERVIPNMALTLRWSVISKSHYGLVVSNIYINNTLNILPSYKVETEVVSKLIWHQDEFLIRKSESPRIVPWVLAEPGVCTTLWSTVSVVSTLWWSFNSWCCRHLEMMTWVLCSALCTPHHQQNYSSKLTFCGWGTL